MSTMSWLSRLLDALRRRRPPRPPSPPLPPDGPPSEEGSKLLELINRLRATRGGSVLRWRDALAQAAQSHAAWMAKHRKLQHLGEGDPAYRAQRAGYWGTVGENIAAWQETPADVYSDWLNSPPHREIMLDPDYSDAGVGWSTDAGGLRYWCLVVGRPT